MQRQMDARAVMPMLVAARPTAVEYTGMIAPSITVQPHAVDSETGGG